jgi:hypothetical protein
MKRLDLTGEKFGRLLVSGLSHKEGRDYIWKCLCECETVCKVKGSSLRTGNTKSCGCLRRESSALQGFQNAKHGMSFTTEILAYRNAMYRCTRPKHKAYRNYGGRGIKFLFTSFKQFYDELGHKPRKDMVLDRIENNGHYEPGNVRWTDRLTSARNRRQPIYI